MDAKRTAKKIVLKTPVLGKQVSRVAAHRHIVKEQADEITGLREAVDRLETRNEAWAAEVRQLRGDDTRFDVLWPVKKSDLIAADYRSHAPGTANKRHKPPYTLNWVVPPVGSVSGGHAVIFYLIHYLETQGHKCRIYFYDPMNTSSLEKVTENMKNHVPVAAELFYNKAKMAECDAIFATSWPTAYPVFNYGGSAKKYYLLQDYEPMFEPSGTYSAISENTYKMNLHGISTTPFTGVRARQEFGMTVDDLELGINPSEYHLTNPKPRKKVLFYARPVTPRRGFELGTLALEIFHKAHPEVEIHCLGWDLQRYNLSFPYQNRKILSTEELNQLYNECAAGLVLSFTSMSLTVVEMMAAGCTPVMNNGPDSGLVSYRKGLRFTEPNPVALAESLSAAIDEQKKKGYIENLAKFTSKFNWDKYNSQLVKILERDLS